MTSKGAGNISTSDRVIRVWGGGRGGWAGAGVRVGVRVEVCIQVGDVGGMGLG